MTTINVKKEYSFDELLENSWSGAINTLEIVRRHDKEDELMYLINDSFTGVPTDTEVNDFLWFEDDFIFEQLDIKNPYSDTEDEEY